MSSEHYVILHDTDTIKNSEILSKIFWQKYSSEFIAFLTMKLYKSVAKR